MVEGSRVWPIARELMTVPREDIVIKITCHPKHRQFTLSLHTYMLKDLYKMHIVQVNLYFAFPNIL